MLTHGNIVADVSGAMFAGLSLNNQDVHLSYLPLAHMFERIVQAALWAEGAAIGFYQGNTLKLMEDIAALRPTVFPSVPRYAAWRLAITRVPLCLLLTSVSGSQSISTNCCMCRLYNRIYDKVIATINTTKGVKGAMLRKAYNTKLANLRKNILTHPFWFVPALAC
jgi:long-chain acyl-CoA synthetase